MLIFKEGRKIFIIFKEVKKKLNVDDAAFLFDEIYNQIQVIEKLNSLKFANINFKTNKNEIFLVNIKNLILFSKKHDFINYIVNDLSWPKKYLQSSLLMSNDDFSIDDFYQIQIVLEFTLNLKQ